MQVSNSVVLGYCRDPCSGSGVCANAAADLDCNQSRFDGCSGSPKCANTGACKQSADTKSKGDKTLRQTDVVQPSTEITQRSFVR